MPGFTIRTNFNDLRLLVSFLLLNQCSKHCLQIGKGVCYCFDKLKTLFAFHIFNTLLLSLENHWHQQDMQRFNYTNNQKKITLQKLMLIYI